MSSVDQWKPIELPSAVNARTLSRYRPIPFSGSVFHSIAKDFQVFADFIPHTHSSMRVSRFYHSSGKKERDKGGEIEREREKGSERDREIERERVRWREKEGATEREREREIDT